MVVTFTRTSDGSCCCLPDSGTGTGTGTGTIADVLTTCCPNPLPHTLCVTITSADCPDLNYEGEMIPFNFSPLPIPPAEGSRDFPWYVCVPLPTSMINPIYATPRPFMAVHLYCDPDTLLWVFTLFIGDNRLFAGTCPGQENPTTNRIGFIGGDPNLICCNPFNSWARFEVLNQALPNYMPCLSPGDEIFVYIRECGTEPSDPCPEWYCWETGPAIYEVAQVNPGGGAIYSGPYSTCEEALANCPGGSCP